MKITAHKSNIKTIRQSDPDFILNDGPVIAPRAGFEFSKHCPTEYKLVVSECINRGWLKPVAHITQQEYFMEKLSK